MKLISYVVKTLNKCYCDFPAMSHVKLCLTFLPTYHGFHNSEEDHSRMVVISDFSLKSLNNIDSGRGSLNSYRTVYKFSRKFCAAMKMDT